MSPNEFNVLRIFEKSDAAGKGMISKRLGISIGYAEYLCLSLFRGGYLEGVSRGQYQPTQKGLSVLFENLLRVRDDLKRNMMLLDEQMDTTDVTLGELRKRQDGHNSEASNYRI